MRQSYRTLSGHLSLTLQVALVTDDDHGEVVLVLDPQNLLLEGGDLFEALPGGNGVDEQEAFAGPHVLLAHGAVLLLTGRVEDIEEGDLVVDVALLPVRVCNSGRTASAEVACAGATEGKGQLTNRRQDVV